MTERHLTKTELEAGLDEIRRAPKNEGVLKMIVRRPRPDTREVIQQAELEMEGGLVGDSWRTRSSRRTADGSAHPEMQINIMGARAIALIAGTEDRWPLAGDQLYIDMDLSEANLPPGTELEIGDAVIEITGQPHTGCSKFTTRFGPDATMWVNSPAGKELHLRGLNARVVRPGSIRVGDTARKR